MSRFRKIGIGICALLALIVAGNLFFVWWVGAWGILFPSTHHETVPPTLADDFGRASTDQPAPLRVLVYSKTNSFRHIEGIAAAHTLFDDLARDRGWAILQTENSASLEAPFLERFDVVVFANTSGDHASDAQDAAFRAWLENGGGWVGIHAAGDDSHASFDWYAQNLMCGIFRGHTMKPQTQRARVVVEAREHPISRDLPDEFYHDEEWYSWDRSARDAGFRVLLTVDESTYRATSFEPSLSGMISQEEVDISMDDHPIVWSGCVGRGRMVYTAMGHWGAAYEQNYTRTLLRNAVEWTGARNSDCGD